MSYESAAAVWEYSFLCVPHDSWLKLSWSVSGPINGNECLELRRTTKNTRGYYLCGTSKFDKIGEFNSIRPRGYIAISRQPEKNILRARTVLSSSFFFILLISNGEKILSNVNAVL